jgi:RNA polymerase sigma-70 factor, ECF subfamily
MHLGRAPAEKGYTPVALARGRCLGLCSCLLGPDSRGRAQCTARPAARQDDKCQVSCKFLREIPVMSSETGRQARFNLLAESYGADLYRYAMWICRDDALAKDLVQETFLRAWKALDKLKDRGAAKSWLITILRREYARSFERKVPRFTDVDAIDVPEDSELAPDERTEIGLLRRNIMNLPKKYREPLLMQVVLGLSCEEISDELGVSKSAVMTQLFRAREQLKSQLQRDGVTGNVHGLF